MKTSARYMDVWERRPLSEGEVALSRTIFGDEIGWEKVRVVQVPDRLGFAAMAPFRNTILFSKWRAWRDFSRAPLGEQAWLVHELTHVWQAHRGVPLMVAKLAALGRRAYRYRAKDGARLKDFNIERQAEIARHLFLSRAGQLDEKAPSAHWLEAVWASR